MDIKKIICTPEVVESLEVAQEIGTKYKNVYYAAVHLLKAVLHPKFSLRNQLLGKDIEVCVLENWADLHIQKAVHTNEFYECERSSQIDQIFLEAMNLAEKMNTNTISLWIIFITICTSDMFFDTQEISTFPIDKNRLLELNFH